MQMSAHAEVRHALAVRQAVYTDDHAAFFRLYAGASPRLSACSEALHPMPVAHSTSSVRTNMSSSSSQAYRDESCQFVHPHASMSGCWMGNDVLAG